eukprot:g40349.t1
MVAKFAGDKKIGRPEFIVHLQLEKVMGIAFLNAIIDLFANGTEVMGGEIALMGTWDLLKTYTSFCCLSSFHSALGTFQQQSGVDHQPETELDSLHKYCGYKSILE